MSEAKQRTQQVVHAHRSRLVALSERVHAHPETTWQEQRASRWVAGALSDPGVDVDVDYLGLEIAFLATSDSGPVQVGLCADYDALPGLGHACGHNLIAAMSVGAGLAWLW